MKKKSAVQWLIWEIRCFESANDKQIVENPHEFNELFKQAKQMEEEQSMIPELSDVEIEEAASIYCASNHSDATGIMMEKNNAFIFAAKWYREQLKSKPRIQTPL